MQNWFTRNEKYVVFTVVLAGLLALVFWYHREQVLVSREAAVRSWVGIDLLAGAVKGRQGLIGSLKWAPLPTLLLLPVVKIPALGTSGLGAAVVAALISAFTVMLLNIWWTRFGVPRALRFPLLVLYQMCPPVLAAVLTGRSTVLMLLILMAGAYFLGSWLRTLDVRSLAYLGVLGGLAIVTLYLSAVIVVLMAVVIVVRVWRVRTPSYRPATLLIYLIPCLYTAALWFTANWLIMGDPVFFLRGIATEERFLAEITELDLDGYLYLMPLLILAAGWVATRGRRRRSARAASVLVTAVLLLAIFAVPYVTEYVMMDRRPTYFGRNEAQLARIDEILSYLDHVHPEAKVFVCGYTAYQFIARTEHRDRFVHLMSVDLARIERETRGQELYFLVPRPYGVYRWEDVNLRLPRLFDDYVDMSVTSDHLEMRFMLGRLGEEWPDWHLIRVVRKDLSEK